MAKISPIKKEHSFAVRLMQHLVVPTFVLDPECRVIIWNRACERLTGIAAADVLGTSDHWQAFYDAPRSCLADVIALGSTDELDALYTAHSEPGEDILGLRAENWCSMPGVKKRLYLAIDAGPIFDEEGKLMAVVETLRDNTEQKMAQMALQSLAIRDSLTGLANRRSFDEKLQADWLHCQHESLPLSLLLLDVDFFKLYNDTYGHQKGDACLQSVTSTLDSQMIRPTDLAARYGGEEFAVIMANTTYEGALQAAERIRQRVESLHVSHSGNPCSDHVTVSIGAATVIPTADYNCAQLLAAADTALYQSKREGRNRVSGVMLQILVSG